MGVSIHRVEQSVEGVGTISVRIVGVLFWAMFKSLMCFRKYRMEVSS